MSPVFESASRSHPDDPRLLEGLAKAYVLAGSQKEVKAQKVFKHLVELNPNSAVGNQEMAANYFRAGKYDDAIHSARKALEAEPENTAAFLVLAWSLWQKQDFSDEAREIYNRAYRSYPDDSLLLRIVTQFSLDSATATAQTGARILKAIQANAGARDFLALAAEAGKRWKNSEITRAALESLAASGELNDDQALTLAEIYVAANETSRASRDLLARAFLLRRDMPGLAHLLGTIIVEEAYLGGEFLDLFNFLLDSECDNPQWFIQVAKIHHQRGEYESMAKTLEAIPQEAASKPDVLRLLALAHSNLKQHAKAINHYRSLLASNPDDTEAIIGLGRAYALMDERTEEMYQIIDRARGLVPDDVFLTYASGQHAALRGKWGEASQYFILALRGGDEYTKLVLDYVGAIVTAYPAASSIPARWLRIQILLCVGRFHDVLEETEAIYSLESQEANRILAVFDRILQG